METTKGSASVTIGPEGERNLHGLRTWHEGGGYSSLKKAEKGGGEGGMGGRG